MHLLVFLLFMKIESETNGTDLCFSKKNLKNDVFYLFLVIFCGFGLYLAIFRLLCSSKPFFSTLDNQDLQKYHERDEDKALNSML